jgi:membrane protease YdiL (CAAX protease family)
VTPGTLSPAQLAFLLWSATFAGAVIARVARTNLGIGGPTSLSIAMVAPCLLDLAVVIGVPRLRQAAREMLRQRVPRACYGEVALIAGVAMLAQPARFGAFALTAWVQDGDAGVLAMGARSALATGGAFGNAALHFAITCVLPPVVEELMFRGFLLQLWMRRRSLLTAILLTSMVFGAGHPNYVHAFMIGTLLAGLYVRTGALRAVIFVHFVANFTSLVPVLGRFAKPAENHGLSSWTAHIGALMAFTALTLAYLLLAARSPKQGWPEKLQPASS